MRHVSCSKCGAIFHPEDLDEEGRCESCAASEQPDETVDREPAEAPPQE